MLKLKHHVKKTTPNSNAQYFSFKSFFFFFFQGLSRLWSHGSWIYNYLWYQCLSPLTLWVRTPLGRGVVDTTLYDKVCQWLVAGQWFSPGTPVSYINKIDRHDITEILLKVALQHHNHPNHQNCLLFCTYRHNFILCLRAFSIIGIRTLKC